MKSFMETPQVRALTPVPLFNATCDNNTVYTTSVANKLSSTSFCIKMNTTYLYKYLHISILFFSQRTGWVVEIMPRPLSVLYPVLLIGRAHVIKRKYIMYKLISEESICEKLVGVTPLHLLFPLLFRSQSLGLYIQGDFGTLLLHQANSGQNMNENSLVAFFTKILKNFS